MCVKQKGGEKANRKKKKVAKKKSKLHWWTLGLKGEKREREEERESGAGRQAPSDRQRDEAVVLLDVTFENV